jgi:hypothetical protein
MSGHLRFRFAAFLLLAGLSTSPASSNPFAALFNAAPEEATAPAPAKEDCLPQPGKTAADGQHWVYRLDGHRKCWFQAAEGRVTVKKLAHHPAAKQHVVAPEENEAALRKPTAVGNVRAELPRPASAERFQPTPPAREFKLVDAVSVIATGAAALVPSAPVAKPATDQLTPDHPTPRPVDVDALLAAAPAASATVVSSVPSARPVPVSLAQAGDEERGWPVTWVGVLLMTLGFVCLLSSSGAIRGLQLYPTRLQHHRPPVPFAKLPRPRKQLSPRSIASS